MKFVGLILLLSAFSFGGAILAQSTRRPTRTSLNGASVRFESVVVRNADVRFPRLTYYQDAKVLQTVNQKIDEITADFGCDGDTSRTAGNYRVKSDVEYSTKQIFSIYASASWFCGGPYPTNDSNISLTFDLKTGKLIEFEDLFQNYEQNKTEILKIVFAAQLERTARLVATGKTREGTCDGDPNLYSLEHLEDSLFAFNFSAEGLRVQPLWPHVMEACSERVTVPYKKLKQFVAPEGLLARVIE
ncbi:MAG: hypothetical protein JST85_25600 [Acidobacteria bacterium]|nr:hypothetical protein [Acidobacteriota bacterium]